MCKEPRKQTSNLCFTDHNTLWPIKIRRQFTVTYILVNNRVSSLKKNLKKIGSEAFF